MNKIFKRIWSANRCAYVVVAETARSVGQTSSAVSGALIASVLLSTGAGAQTLAAGVLPTGGQVTAGQASIASQGAVMNVQQSSQRAAINWQSFSIGSGATVNFQQPSASAVTLNRVVGAERSVIDGALKANGNVYILNANGVLFNRSAQVNVGGLVASTLNISDADFMAGKTTFESTGSRGSIINLGTLTAANAGHIALLGQHVANEGVISATLGAAVLAAGDKVSLNFNGNSLVGVAVDRGTLNALVENKQAIMADGGRVTLTAKGLDQVMQTVVNNTGEIRAQTLQNQEGKIYLLGGMTNDRIEAGGKLDASAPHGGHGGFVETSAAHVQIKDDVRVTTQAARGRTGTWLIDPNDYTVAASGGNITGVVLGNQLATNNVEISTALAGTSGGNGDIFVNDNISWSSGNRLTLTAERHIKINATIDASGGSGGAVTLNYGQGAVATANTAGYDFGLTSTGFAGKIKLQAGQNFTTKLGSDGAPINWTVITQLGSAGDETQAGATNSLQGLADSSRLAGNFVLGADVDASATAGWNSGQGFKPIGLLTNAQTGDPLNVGQAFSGSFDGLGNAINGLHMDQTSYERVSTGLFGTVLSSNLKNLEFKNANIKGGNVISTQAFADQDRVISGTGILAGNAINTNISNILISGPIGSNTLTATGRNNLGGLVGNYEIANDASLDYGVSNIYVNATLNVGYDAGVGGINEDVDYNRTGGLFGSAFGFGNKFINLKNVHFNGSINDLTSRAMERVGGLIGLSGLINISHATVTANILALISDRTAQYIGGAVGIIEYSSDQNIETNGTLPYSSLTDIAVSGHIRGSGNVGGIVGHTGYTLFNRVKNSANISYVYRNDYFGGLVGRGYSLKILDSSNTGHVTGGDRYVGGFVGEGGGLEIRRSFSTGNITSDSTYSTHSALKLGGLIGYAASGLILSDSYSTGDVMPKTGKPAGEIGGLIGWWRSGDRDDVITGSYSSGKIGSAANPFGNKVGGLIGKMESTTSSNFAQIIDSRYIGPGIYGADEVGGLIGTITWTQSGQNSLHKVERSYSTGSVTGRDYVGGLFGKISNLAVSESYATGHVSGRNFVGGLAGEISTAYTETINYTNVYGVDPDYPHVVSSVRNSYAKGNVTASGEKGGGFIGGLFFGSLENVYSTGAVMASTHAGGLVGSAVYDKPVGELYGYDENSKEVACSISSVCNYAYFKITGSEPALATNSVINSFWDVQTSGLGMVNSPQQSAGGIGQSTMEMQKNTLFKNAGWSLSTPINGSSYPYLLWLDGQSTPVWQSYGTPVSNFVPPVTPRLLAPESGQTGGKTSDVLLPASYVVNTAARLNTGTAQSMPGNVVTIPPSLSLPFAQGENLSVISSPNAVESTTPVTLSQALVMTREQGSGASEGTGEVRVPVSRNSLVEIVNGGVRLPGGVEQQLFVVRQ